LHQQFNEKFVPVPAPIICATASASCSGARRQEIVDAADSNNNTRDQQGHQ
jgi:hypothetical protein